MWERARKGGEGGGEVSAVYMTKTTQGLDLFDVDGDSDESCN